MTFPGSIKGCANALLPSSSHIFRAGQTDSPAQTSCRAPTFKRGRRHSTMGHCSFWSPLSSIHSFWTSQIQVRFLIPARNSQLFFLFVRLSVQVLSFRLSLKLLKLINILVHIPVVSFLLNVIGQTTICLFVKKICFLKSKCSCDNTA